MHRAVAGVVGVALSVVSLRASAECFFEPYVYAERGDVDKLRECLDAGRSVEEDYNGQTPLQGATAAGQPLTTRLLVERGARVNVPPGTMSPLMHGARGGSSEVIRILLA